MTIDDIESQHVDGKHGDSIDMEDPRHHRMLRYRGMLETSARSLTSECCIYRVPEKLRKLNEAAYTPRVISIGPFHHGNKQVQIMEKHKRRHLNHFLGQAKVSLEELFTVIEGWEERVRCCYAETIELSSDEFVPMILLDGGFIIDYMFRCFKSLADKHDEVLYKPWLKNDIIRDLLLLENQLPFFVLEGLFNLTSLSDPKGFATFLELTFHFFSRFNKQNKPPKNQEIKNFLDLIRTLHLPSTPRIPDKCLGRSPYSAMELDEAGVMFKRDRDSCLFNIKLTAAVLKIPEFIVEDDTECLFRNLMALEQCHYPNQYSYICDYIWLMATLANTTKDAELLIEKDIIFNWSNADVASLFNNLCQEILVDKDLSYFCELHDALQFYYRHPWHHIWPFWRKTLKLDYFSTPWKTLSTFAAVILLVLTLIQTTNSFG